MTSEVPVGAINALPVTVLIPTVGRPFWLENCIRAVSALDPKPSAVLVVGRSEDSASAKVAEAFSEQVSWAVVDRPGHVDPIRVALKLCSTQFLAIIDDDAEPLRTDWLAQLCEPFNDRRVGLVGSRVLEPQAPMRRVRRSAGRVRWFGRPIGNTAARNDPNPVEVDMVPEGNCMWRVDAIRPTAIDEIWDEDDAALYGLDLALHAKQSGWRVLFTSSAPIIHHVAPRVSHVGSRTDVEHRVEVLARNLTFIALKHFRWRLFPYFVWSTLIGDRTSVGLASAALHRSRGLRLYARAMRGRVEAVRAFRASR